jgi:hypothetical protein
LVRRFTVSVTLQAVSSLSYSPMVRFVFVG